MQIDTQQQKRKMNDASSQDVYKASKMPRKVSFSENVTVREYYYEKCCTPSNNPITPLGYDEDVDNAIIARCTERTYGTIDVQKSTQRSRDTIEFEIKGSLLNKCAKLKNSRFYDIIAHVGEARRIFMHTGISTEYGCFQTKLIIFATKGESVDFVLYRKIRGRHVKLASTSAVVGEHVRSHKE